MVFQGERRWDQSSSTEYKRKRGGSKENLLLKSEDHKNNYYRALWGGDQVNFFMTLPTSSSLGDRSRILASWAQIPLLL